MNIESLFKYRMVAVGLTPIGLPKEGEPIIPAYNTMVTKAILWEGPEINDEVMAKAVKLGHWQEIEWERRQSEYLYSGTFSHVPPAPRYVGTIIEEADVPVVVQAFGCEPSKHIHLIAFKS